MRLARAVLMVFGVLALGCKREAPPRPTGPLARSNQLVVVRSADWAASRGTLQRYTRKDRAGAWLPIGAPVPVSLGPAGLGWGRGVHGEQQGPVKADADGRAPAGVFRLRATIGTASEPPGNLPYSQATDDTLCIDDPASLRYNKIVRRSDIQHPDWARALELKPADDRYKVAVVIEHNTDPVRPGAGACALLHVRAATDRPIDSGTAMDLEAAVTLARWLDWMAEPLLVQLPDSEYGRRRKDWGLP